jgi:polyhydroxyalkanoate synthase
MNTATDQARNEQSLAERVRTEVERAIRRNIKGLEYLASPAPPIGTTPRERLYRRGTLQLYRYRPLASELYRVPLLLVMATTQRATIFDLAPGQSLVEFLLRQGFDVYVMDWAAPRPDEKHLRLDDYVLDFIPECLRRVSADSGIDDVSLIGYCMGGILSTIYAALHADAGSLKNLVCFTTPIDFSKMELFARWTHQRHFDVDRLVDSVGNIPPELLIEVFAMLRPADRLVNPIRLYDNLWNDEYVVAKRRLDRWANDMLPLAGEYFRQTTKDLLWGNKLVKNELEVGGRRVDLSKIKVPLLHIVAAQDHIAPYEATSPLVRSVGSRDKEEVVLKGGHASIVTGRGAAKRVWPKLDDWLGVRST